MFGFLSIKSPHSMDRHFSKVCPSVPSILWNQWRIIQVRKYRLCDFCLKVCFARAAALKWNLKRVTYRLPVKWAMTIHPLHARPDRAPTQEEIPVRAGDDNE